MDAAISDGSILWLKPDDGATQRRLIEHITGANLRICGAD